VPQRAHSQALQVEGESGEAERSRTQVAQVDAKIVQERRHVESAHHPLPAHPTAREKKPIVSTEEEERGEEGRAHHAPIRVGGSPLDEIGDHHVSQMRCELLHLHGRPEARRTDGEVWQSGFQDQRRREEEEEEEEEEKKEEGGASASWSSALSRPKLEKVSELRGFLHDLTSSGLIGQTEEEEKSSKMRTTDPKVSAA